MLTSIECSRFRQHKIEFGPGLNVVLGDERATNSIGKSTLLMVVDFAFGGTTLLSHNTDLVAELGHHAYVFTFQFGKERYRFQRRTDQPKVVFTCDDEGEVGKPLSLERYSAFLQKSYGLDTADLSFRALIGLYFRIWGKENDDVHKPLHIAKAQPARECVENLIKTFQMFESIRTLSQRLEEEEKRLSGLRGAVKANLMPSIGQRQHAANLERIESVEREIEDIKAGLAIYAADISILVDRTMMELKEARDNLRESKAAIESRLARLNRNLSENRHIKSKHFESLVEFFPDMNQSRLADVEEFHNGVAKLLRTELQDSKRILEARSESVQRELEAVEGKMAEALASIEQPASIVDRVVNLSSTWGEAKRENAAFEESTRLKDSISDVKASLSTIKRDVLAEIQFKVNEAIEQIVGTVFEPGRKSPTLLLSENSYSFEVFEDTGTGTAFSALVIFDLAIFLSTIVPSIAHDSIFFKNIENDSVAKLLQVYTSTEKQSFVAIDEAKKYGVAASKLLEDRAAIRLSDDFVLYDKDWRNRV